MHKGKTQRQFKNFKIYRDLYGKPLKHDWVASVFPKSCCYLLLSFGGCCNRFFWDIRLTFYRLSNFNTSVSVPAKFSTMHINELFLCLQKVDHMTNYCKRPTQSNFVVNNSLQVKNLPCLVTLQSFLKYGKYVEGREETKVKRDNWDLILSQIQWN